MKLQLTALALGLGFAGFASAAQYNYTSTDYTASAKATGGGADFTTNGFKESFEEGSASISLESNATDLEKSGIHFQTQADSTAGVLSTENRVSWDKPIDPTMVLEAFSSSANATTHEDTDRDFSGKVRFVVDYELYVNSPGAVASITFNGWANLLNPDDEFFPEIGTASFSEYLYSFEKDNALSKKGTWTSDWLSFSNGVELKDLAVYTYSYGYFLQTTSSATSDSYLVSTPGALNSNTYAKIYLETSPAPEPETYALMIAGLVMTGIVSKRRKRK